jgi:hypothetical protein
MEASSNRQQTHVFGESHQTAENRRSLRILHPDELYRDVTVAQRSRGPSAQAETCAIAQFLSSPSLLSSTM